MMRRSTPFLTVAAALLTLAGTALAAPPELPAAQGEPGHGFVPAHEAVLGDASINGRVLKYDGSPYDYATQVFWAVLGEGDLGHTDAEGRFSFTGIPAAENNGSLSAACGAGEHIYRLDGLSWEAPGPTSFEIRPGAVDLEVTFGSQAEDSNYLRIDVTTSDGNVSTRAETSIFSTDPSWAGPAYVLPGTITSAALYFGRRDQGTELPDLVGQTVTAGATLPGTYTVEQWAAQRVWLGGWASGRPNSKARLWIENYPEGWVNLLSGAATGSAPPFSHYGKWTSGGETARSKVVTIPAKAKPGEFYWITASHFDGPLTLTTPYQVCSLNAGKTTIRKGSRIRLSGVVPSWRWGMDPVKSKKVIVYKRVTAAGQPGRRGGFTRWNGWTRVGTYTANDRGKFRTGYLRPSRSTWYVVWYPGDGAYRGAYTSVRKVTVK